MRSRSACSILAGIGAVAVVGTASAPSVIAEPTPDPTGTTTKSPSKPPSSDPAPSDPPATTAPPSDPPKPSDPPEPSNPPKPSDPPKTSEPPDPPSPTASPKPPDSSEPPDPPGPSKPPGSPGPSQPPDAPGDPAVPELSLGLSVSSATTRPGGSVTATVRVASRNATAQSTVLRISAAGASVSPQTRGLGAVGGGGAAALATVRVPSDARPGMITVSATASAAKAKGASQSFTLIVTDAAGAPPAGVSLANLPSGVPPLTAGGFNPLASMRGPQVALPPVAAPQVAPQVAPEAGPLVPVSGLHELPGTPLTVEELGALQAGFLSALAASVTLLLLRLRLIRRAAVVRPPRADRRRLRAAGKRPTAARLRTLPPRPARKR